MKNLKEQIISNIDNEKENILLLSKKVHENPELAFHEYKSSKLIINQLRNKGYYVEQKVGGLDTAFIASANTHNSLSKNEHPRIAILAEYDALPEMGHACGHNIISAAAYGAFIGLSPLLENIPGEVVLIGTPAEERGGGKIIMLEEGVFDTIDYAMMVHPSSKNLVNRGGLAIISVTIEYIGHPSHSSSPELGINALNACIQTFNSIDAIKEEFPLKTNINGIIINGGEVSNIIPSKSTCEFSIRAATFFDLKTVIDRLERIIRSVEILTGASAKYVFGQPYAERYSNRVMDDVFKEKLEFFNEVVQYPDPKEKVGSSDIGNLSLRLPIIHPYIKICDNISGHTPAFEKAAISHRANEMIIKGAKAMALTAYEILNDKNLRESINNEFNETVPDYTDFKLI